jgi:hypothetical protein
VLGADNGFEIQPRSDSDAARDGSVFTQFDPPMARERAEGPSSADRVKDQFLATLCHQLRSPISPVLSVDTLRYGASESICALY